MSRYARHRASKTLAVPGIERTPEASYLLRFGYGRSCLVSNEPRLYFNQPHATATPVAGIIRLSRY